MLRVLLGLILAYGVVAGAAFATGLLVDDRHSFGVHFSLGLLCTLFTCLTYCIVLTYFIITGKLVKNAVLKGHLDPEFISQTQRLKGWVSGLTVLAVGATLAAALFGAAGQSEQAGVYGRSMTVHLVAECAAVAVNGFALYCIWQLVYRNSHLVQNILDQLQASGQLRGRDRGGAGE
jgi:zinc transporter ZupT